MTAFTTEKTGTVSIDNGSTALTGTDTLLSVRACDGGILFSGNGFGVIASVESDTAATMELGWNGTTVEDATYIIVRSPASAARLVNAQDKLADLVNLLEGQFYFDYDGFGTVLADRDAFDDEAIGFKFALLSGGAPVLYVRTGSAGTWTDAITIKGDTGPAGAQGENGAAADFSGSGAPSDSLGVDGQTYINVVNGDTYLKASGTWGSAVGSIKGDQGDQGIQGIQGETGDDGQALDHKGSGAPSDVLGVDGDTYLNIDNGDTYLKAAGTWGSAVGSIQGPQGDDGADGADGVSASPLLVLAVSSFVGTYVATGDMFADSYGSLAMVDNAGATNLDTSEAGYLKPSAGPDSYSDVLTPTMEGDTGGYSGYTVVQVLNPSLLTGIAGQTGFLEVTLKASSTEALLVSAVQVGHVAAVGDAYDFEATPVQASSITGNPAAANGEIVQVVQFTVQESKALAISWYCGGATNQDGMRRRTTATAGYAAFNKLGSEAATVNKTGYSSDSPIVGVSKIRFAPIVNGNLTVASEIIPVAAQPAAISGNVRVIPTDALTLNTDLMLDVSRDDGDNWNEAVLELAFTDGGFSVLSFDSVDLSADPAASEPRYRFRSANNKNFKIDGIALEFEA